MLSLRLQICDICRESFEQFWDEDHEAWHLKDAVRVNQKVSWKMPALQSLKSKLLAVFNYGHRLINKSQN